MFLTTLSRTQSNTVRTQFFQVLYKLSRFKDFATLFQQYFEDPTSIPREAKVNEKRDGTFDATLGLNVKVPNAITAITCGDRMDRTRGTTALFNKWLEDYQAVTTYGWEITSSGTLRCSVWPTVAKERYDKPFRDIKTKNLILFINTPYDPVTPMKSAENSASAFVGAKLLRSSGLGVSLELIRSILN